MLDLMHLIPDSQQVTNLDRQRQEYASGRPDKRPMEIFFFQLDHQWLRWQARQPWASASCPPPRRTLVHSGEADNVCKMHVQC